MNKILIQLLKVIIENIAIKDDISYSLQLQDDIKKMLPNMPHGFCRELNLLVEKMRSELLALSIFNYYYNERKGLKNE